MCVHTESFIADFQPMRPPALVSFPGDEQFISNKPMSLDTDFVCVCVRTPDGVCAFADLTAGSLSKNSVSFCTRSACIDRPSRASVFV